MASNKQPYGEYETAYISIEFVKKMTRGAMYSSDEINESFVGRY